jgi:hypothetical protein
MYEDSPLRKCSTTTCCSSYTYAYQDFFEASVEDPEEPFLGTGNENGEPGQRPGQGQVAGGGAGFDQGQRPGSVSGSGSCTIDISTPGTFIGESRSF